MILLMFIYLLMCFLYCGWKFLKLTINSKFKVGEGTAHTTNDALHSVKLLTKEYSHGLECTHFL